jgi:ABC-2 type transport system ATP-binding protein
VDQVDLLIAPGETFGLLGPNGAGKTTTIRMLTTLLKPDEGTVTVFGVDAAAHPMRVRRLIGYVPQLLSAGASLTGWENVELFARLFDVPAGCAGGGWLRPCWRWASPRRPSGW